MLRGFGFGRETLRQEPVPALAGEAALGLPQAANGEESEWAPEPPLAEPGAPSAAARRRVFTWKRLALAIILLGFLSGAAAYSQKERLAPEVADMSRRLIGDERTARIEGWFFKVEDQIDRAKYRLLGGETNPFATRQIRVEFVPKPPAREIHFSAGNGADHLPAPDAFQPLPMIPPATRALREDLEEGEGVWTSLGLPLSSGPEPLMMKTFIRPDTARPYALAGVLLIDHRRVRLHLVGGTEDPGGDLGVRGPGAIPDEHRDELLAAWNGGFKGPHGGFGMVANGLTYRALRNGLATICVKDSGAIVLGEYGRDFTWDESFDSCRQNVILLVDRGEVSRRTTEGNDTWGYVQVNSSEFITWRSAVGLTKDGDLLVAAGNSLSAETLAKALWAAGAEYAMQLDINSPYVLAGLFFRQPDGTVKPEKFMDSMPDGASRFLRTQERDFMYVTLDESGYR